MGLCGGREGSPGLWVVLSSSRCFPPGESLGVSLGEGVKLCWASLAAALESLAALLGKPRQRPLPLTGALCDRLEAERT